MLEYGFDVHPVSDGVIHRFKGPEDKQQNGWYVYHGDHGAFGNWKTNLTVPWSDSTASRIDKDEYRKLVERERAERKREETVKHADAARQARSLWAQSAPATEHPYLKCKQVQPHGIRVLEGRLVVPMTIDTHIHSLQFITDDVKKFMPGGRVKGCYYPIGKLTNLIWIAEGFATAATVHEVTGQASVCAFNTGNLAAVTKHFVAMGLQVYIAADKDKAGWEAAGKARLVGAECRVAPDFNDGRVGTDWNDYCALYGPEHTREVLNGA